MCACGCVCKACGFFAQKLKTGTPTKLLVTTGSHNIVACVSTKCTVSICCASFFLLLFFLADESATKLLTIHTFIILSLSLLLLLRLSFTNYGIIDFLLSFPFSSILLILFSILLKYVFIEITRRKYVIL